MFDLALSLWVSHYPEGYGHSGTIDEAWLEQHPGRLSNPGFRARVKNRVGDSNTVWDKAALLKDKRAFIEHLQRLESEGCL